MQNFTSLDRVRFLREQLEKFRHKNLHLFPDFGTTLFTYEPLSECKWSLVHKKHHFSSIMSLDHNYEKSVSLSI